jgi:Uma2 family endonuclease
MTAVVPSHQRQSLSTERVLLSRIPWATFQILIRDLESQPSKRLTYDDGQLEIWMPLPPHESYKRWLSRLVEILTEELDIEIRSLGSTTWTRQDLVKGVEADECYYIQNERVVRGRMDIDLTVDPPPDLAIEIDITSLSIPRLPIYAALKVPEVWRFDGEQLEFLQLVDDKYQVIAQSLALPCIQPMDVLGLLNRIGEMGETSWAKAVRSWAREQRSTQ